jgi:hypothetical protein
VIEPGEGAAEVVEEVVEEPPASVIVDAVSVLVTARTDLEILADSQMGSGRPVGWSGNFDVNNPQLALLIRLDLELLSGELYGQAARPPGWFGAIPSTPASVARDIRHDLELLADSVVDLNVRPPGWSGDDPLMRCNRATQNLVSVLERASVVMQADPNSLDYCFRVEVEASQYVEGQILTRSVVAADAAALLTGDNPEAPVAGSGEANTDFTLAFLDRNAGQRAGVIPRGVTFSPLARSYAQFSNMMVVQGEGFVVFVDYTQTSISGDTFDGLPNIDSTEFSVACLVEWCE